MEIEPGDDVVSVWVDGGNLLRLPFLCCRRVRGFGQLKFGSRSNFPVGAFELRGFVNPGEDFLPALIGSKKASHLMPTNFKKC